MESRVASKSQRREAESKPAREAQRAGNMMRSRESRGSQRQEMDSRAARNEEARGRK